MSFADYTSLQASVISWLHGGDATSIAPDLITLAEQDFNDELRVRQMESQTSISITAGYLPHPSDWLEWKMVEVVTNGGTHRVSPETEENASDNAYGVTSSEPYEFVVRGDRTYIRPPPDSSSYSYPTIYFAKIPALSASANSNWLLTRYPGAYLYGALYHAKAYLEESTWSLFAAERQRQIDKISADSRRAFYGRQNLTMKPDVKV